MTPAPAPESSEPDYVHIEDGSDRDYRLISMYELKKIEHTINEECVGKNDGCPPGHLKEMHDQGNETINRVRSRPHTPAAENPFNLPNPYCPEHTGFRDNSGDIKPLPFIYARNGYYYCSKCLDKLFEQHLREREGAKTEREKVLTFLQHNLEKIDYDDPDEIYDTIQLLKSNEGITQLKSMGWVESLRAQPENTSSRGE